MNEAATEKSATYGLPENLDYVSDLKTQNGDPRISKLPPELLLRIFVVGDEEQRARRKERAPYHGFQDLVTRVCTHWRCVAINDPALWTYIYISRPPPHDSAVLYLSRCGSNSLLDIDLEMMNSFFDKHADLDHWPSKTSSTKTTIDLLAQHGAPTSRWKSLIVCSEVPPVLYKTLEYIHPESAPALQFLSVEWRVRVNPILAFQDENQSLAYTLIFNNVYPNSGDRFPRLRHAEFNAVPTGFLFKRPLPMLAGLTHLKLIPAFNLFSQGKLHTLLSANQQLQSLEISIGFADGDRFEPTDLRVTLPSLRSLILTWGSSPAWAQGVIKMINGPVIEHLKLSCYGSQPEAVSELVKQILNHTMGESGTDAPPASTNDQSRQQVYPSLRHLDISNLHLGDDYTGIFRDLLSTLPTITFLAASANVLVLLRDQPWLLPQLERVTVPGEPPEELGDVLRRREEGGCPVKTVEIQEQYLDLVRDTLPGSLAIIKLPPSAPAVQHDSDDEPEIDFDEDFEPDYHDYDDGEYYDDEEHYEDDYDDYSGGDEY